MRSIQEKTTAKLIPFFVQSWSGLKNLIIMAMKLIQDNIIFKPITNEMRQLLHTFVCVKEPDIEKFFHNEAVSYSEQMLGSSYCFIDSASKEIVGAFCVACASIETSKMPKPMRNKLNRKIPYTKQRETYPAILLAQLAIADKYQGQNLGDWLLDFVKCWAHDESKRLAARFMIIDALNHPKVLSFYARNNFKYVFPTEDEEKIVEGMDFSQPLKTRFMVTDLQETSRISV